MTDLAPLLEMQGIGKSFGAVSVLHDVSFRLLPGEVHVLAGENGAGKSTLIKIASGVHRDFSGEIRLNGRPVRFRSPHDAAMQGIAVIHQEMSLVNSLPVVDNIFLGQRLGGRFWLRPRLEEDRARACLAQLGLAIELDKKVEDYPLAVRQMIEIAKALAQEARVVIMDEPTSALNAPEIEKLFQVIADLRSRGCGIVYITHRMEEIYQIADRVTVLRDGRNAGTETTAALPPDRLVQWMVGREISDQFPKRVSRPGGKKLEVKHFSVPDPTGVRQYAVRDLSFDLFAGEIVGIAGLEGSGKSELLNGLFGVYGPLAGASLVLEGRAFSVRSPGDSIARGLALLTNDRKETGLIPSLDLARNITVASLAAFSPKGWIDHRQEEVASEVQVRRLGVRASSVRQDIKTLSGGNQQKVLLARWLQTGPRVLLLDEPTRGVDVAAKHDMYQLINRCTDEGMAVLLVTSELPELLALSDRILVLHRGCLAAEINRQEANAEKVLSAAMGRNWSDGDSSRYCDGAGRT
ncbi:MAG: sugar ABC transporter ATP-binding protein [Acidobacteriota bacterium]